MRVMVDGEGEDGVENPEMPNGVAGRAARERRRGVAARERRRGVAVREREDGKGLRGKENDAGKEGREVEAWCQMLNLSSLPLMPSTTTPSE